MIIVMETGVKEDQVQQVVDRLEKAGLGTHLSVGEFKTIIGAIGDEKIVRELALDALPFVEKVLPITKPFKLVSREFQEQSTSFKVGNCTIGADEVVVMAGPCAVESEEQLLESAEGVKAAGAQILRGGAFKPRTSPYSFQGLEEEGLKILARVREKTGLPIVTEVMDQHTVGVVAEYADIIQVGTRNMQNFYMLRELGKLDKPILLKRGLSATIEEWLMAAEYIASGGNRKVILCERGIRTFETATRNTLDLSAIPVVKHLTHLPVIVDPSHGTGNWRWVPSMSRAAVAAGADGLMVEVHPRPEEALCDGAQSLTVEKFEALTEDLDKVARVLGRRLKKVD
ncbi:3-deoxy-7-phosphoheptulonate synthase [Dethiobacter alkaliphilus]|uniref:3-deoxy-7-phosphoheptulonate synthase n=1 Tax=Dethiobacter alkaliphilus TaxID=427926 RepID=UPI0022260243|nr:3-deoxy-7-phosphoheptulonate synthase [Dethiobacter alkaliphilus]MCW3491300.1 3-deoxy-7-phosphoheptulonate synthase [Dethiobacter alkaliphilus]